MTYYREAVIHTNEMLDLLVKSENKIQVCSLPCHAELALKPSRLESRFACLYVFVCGG